MYVKADHDSSADYRILLKLIQKVLGLTTMSAASEMSEYGQYLVPLLGNQRWLFKTPDEIFIHTIHLYRQ